MGRSYVHVALALTIALAKAASADQPTLLNVDTSCVTSGGTAPSPQSVSLAAAFRGVTASGALRVAPSFGWQLNADSAAVDEIAGRYLGPVDLLSGTVSYTDQQLVLPAIAAWPIGVSFSNAQTAGTVDGPQGRNWFQNSQPCVSAPDSSHVIRLFYAADAFVEYHQIDETNYYAGVNGAGGVLSIENATEGEHTVQIYVLHDQAGNEIKFFGHSGVPDGASGQLWKYTVAKSTQVGAADVSAYVGDVSLPYTAAHDGYENGRIVTAFDSAGRKYVYSYTSVGSVDRLTSVTALTGTTTIATVEYSYYGQSGITSGTNGTSGDLAMIRATLPTSFGASGSDPAIEDVRENRFYYDGSSRLKLVLGYEGTRRHLVATGGSPVSWTASSSALATALNGLAETRVVYETATPYRVASVWFDGMDGAGTNPNGQYDIAYESHGSLATPWNDRTVVKLPAFKRFSGTSFSSPSETTASTWSTQYFDDIGQPLSTVVSDIDPASTSGTPKFWITGIERDSSRRLIAINTPANCSNYIHTSSTATKGTFDRSASAGLVTYFERAGSGAGLDGLVKAVRRGEGKGTAYGSTSYVSSSVLTLQDQTLSSGTPTVKVHKPIATASRVYPTATTTEGASGTYNQTNYRYAWWGGTIVPQYIETTLPAVSVANNGTNTTDTRKTWFSHLGQTIVTRLPNKRLDTGEYDSTTGLLVRQTTDAVTPTSTNFTHFGDLPTGTEAPAQATIGQETTPYGVATEYAYDSLGRISQTIANPSKSIGDGRLVSRLYYTRLSDRRLVRLGVPTVDDSNSSAPVYCGPVAAAVINHAGFAEEAGQISLSDPTVRDATYPSRFTTTSSPRTWLAAPASSLQDDCLPKAQHNHTASGSPALVSYGLSLTSPDGSRVVESRLYTHVPTSGTTAADFRGAANTDGNNHDFDYGLIRYNALGLVDRTEDFTRTIDLNSFDVLGRVVQRSRGTVESGTGANIHPYTSVVYDAVNYGTYTSNNLNVAGSNGNVTQVFQHPSGAFGGSDDIHSFTRYDGLDNPTHMWRDGGPFLASSVDNLGRTVSAAAFNGTVSGWNTSGPATTATSSGSGQYRQRYAQTAYDERGRTFRRSVSAIDPTSGVASTTAGETFTTNTFWGANNVVKGSAGSATQLMARDRLCQLKSHMSVIATAGTETQSQLNAQMIAADPTNAIVIGQTNYYRDPTHRYTVATASAQRGSADVTSTGIGSYPTPTFGALMDVPDVPVPSTNPPCLQIAYDPSISRLGMGMRGSHPVSNVLLDIRTFQFDALMMVPLKTFMLGDTLRHDSPPTQICCGLTGCGTPFPSATLPYIEENTDLDPRRAMCRAVTTDWESGERTTVARSYNAAGQVLHTMRARSTVTPVVAFPDGGTPLTPESGPACCGETERADSEWDKGRIKLERMFLCDPPTNLNTFNPLDESSWSGCSSSCPKTTSFGYPDYAPDTTGSGGGGFYPWNAPDAPTHTPNDNNLLLWNVRPIGGQPDTNWHAGRSNGSDDTDWFTYDYLGRPTRAYMFPFRKSNFGDGNPAPSTNAPARHVFYGAGGYPVDWRTPSGDHLNPWERLNVDRDSMGRPTQMRHYFGAFAPTGTPTPNDAIDFGYDRFGQIGSYGQTFDGMFPSGCSGGALSCNLVREGTPQQEVKLNDRVLQAWQGPRVVRQSLPVPNMEVGMAYFPNPSGTDDTTMYPGGGGGGYMPQLVEPRLNWAMGRPMGIFQGNGTNHYQTPLSQYEYVGASTPLYRSMLLAGPTGMDDWPGLPTQYAPVGRPPSSGTPMAPIPHEGPDWRHRTRNDVWRPGIDNPPSSITSTQYNLLLEAEGPKHLVWSGSHLISMLDPATSPDFDGTGGPSPISGFDINGHDEYTRFDCNGRPIYWMSGQLIGKGKSPTASGSPFQAAQNAWLNGLTSPTGVNSSAAAKPGTSGGVFPALTEVEFRWHNPPGSGGSAGGGCAGTGPQSGWLMAPSGAFNVDHPLSPNYGSGGAPAFDEWRQHTVVDASESCTAEGINSRTASEQRKATSGSSVVNYPPPGTSSHYPLTFAYDAAGNVSYDGRYYYQYDGSNRLKDVFSAEWPSGVPTRGNRRAHFDYDGLGRLIKSQYDTDADATDDLSDEDTEWTPRDHMGRPLGIWRQAPTSGACAKPYQVFAYHNTSFRGEGSDDSRGILDCPAVRWRDTGSGDLDETVSYLQDFRGDVRALVSPASGVLERDRYGLTGRPESFPAADVNFDGKVDEDDYDDFGQARKYFDSTHYDPRADLDRDGDVDDDDETLFAASYEAYAGFNGQWRLSSGLGLAPSRNGAASGLDNRFGWRGYWYDPKLQVYHVRNRAYDPRQGQFLQTDPLGFGAGDQNLYRYCDGNFSGGYDPLGLRCVPAIPGHPENGFHCFDDGCDGYEGLEDFHGPSNNDDWLDHLANLGGGLGDGLSLGLTALARRGIDNVFGSNLSEFVNTASAEYRVGVGVGAAVTIVTTGGAGISGASAFMATANGSMLTAIGIGGASEVIIQGAQGINGVRDHWDVPGVLRSAVLSGAFAGAFNQIVVPLGQAAFQAVRAEAQAYGAALRGGGAGAAGEAGAAAPTAGGTSACGSGPASGYLEVSQAHASSRAVQNFNSSTPTDFIFDPQSQRFIMGRGPFGHDSILQAGGITPSATTVGGRIFRSGGGLITDEWSGHYGLNWTPAIRENFESFMRQHGVEITHTPWGQ